MLQLQVGHSGVGRAYLSRETTVRRVVTIAKRRRYPELAYHSGRGWSAASVRIARNVAEASESQTMIVTRCDFTSCDDSPLDVIQRPCSW